MSISNSKREGRRKKASFAWSGSLGVLIIALMLLAGSSFAFIGSATAPMTATVYAQEGDNNTANSTPDNITTTATSPAT